MNRRRRHVVLDAAALAQARASQLLALDARTVAGGMLAISATAPEDGAPSIPVAVVSIEGPLAQRAFYECGYVDGYDAIAERFAAAIKDPAVRAVVLRIDSPGGDLAGCEEGIRRMVAARDAAAKPVYAYIDELAASAAFWIASAVADSGVYLPPSGAVGSVGVTAALVDQTKALEQAGIGVTLVRDPPGKAEAHPLGPVTDLALERLTALVSSASTRFAEAIGRARGMTGARVRATNAAVYYGAEAIAVGYADGIATYEDVLALAGGMTTGPALRAAGRSKMHTGARALRAADEMDDREAPCAVCAHPRGEHPDDGECEHETCTCGEFSSEDAPPKKAPEKAP